MKKNMRLAALLSAAVLLFAGCGKKEENPSDNVKLGEYKGLTISKYDLSVTDEDVNAKIASFLQDNAKKTMVTDRAAEEGDEVVIDFEGSVDGETSEGMTGTDYTIESLCSGGYIHGFEEGIVGHKAGDEFVLDLQFPDPYRQNEELAGKPVTFKMELKSIYTWEVPEYNDETVSAYAGYNTTQEYEEQLKSDIAEEKAQNKDSSQKNELWGKIVEASQIREYPQEDVDSYVEDMKNYYQQYATLYQMEYEDFIKTYTNFSTVSEAEEYMESEAKNYVKQSLVMKEIVKRENITINDDEYLSYCNKNMGQYGYETVEDFEAAYTREGIEESIYFEKMMDLLLSTAIEE